MYELSSVMEYTVPPSIQIYEPVGAILIQSITVSVVPNLSSVTMSDIEIKASRYILKIQLALGMLTYVFLNESVRKVCVHCSLIH